MNNMQGRRNLCYQSPVLQNSIHVLPSNQKCFLNNQTSFPQLTATCSMAKQQRRKGVASGTSIVISVWGKSYTCMQSPSLPKRKRQIICRLSQGFHFGWDWMRFYQRLFLPRVGGPRFGQPPKSAEVTDVAGFRRHWNLQTSSIFDYISPPLTNPIQMGLMTKWYNEKVTLMLPKAVGQLVFAKNYMQIEQTLLILERST